MKLAPAFILFCIIVVEGYIVLSSELLAIRQTTPFVGSGTDTVSIIIAAVAIIVFSTSGAVSWLHAAIMVPGVALGGYFGVQMAKRVPQKVLRWVVVAAGLGLSIYYFATG